ncbi:IS110 family transposase [Streptomyces mirabilis]|uniref:IS110 family transposase n=1 Tax=Streptomyces mirabilis TaxID=68239 RepID=UPI002E299EAA|nr:transposase [Streptomyces mirabilis]
MFVGWDWASASHDVTVIEDRGIVIDHWAFQHSEDDFETALARLASHGTPAVLPVIIERSSGLVVDRLLEAGHPVVPVHPTAFHAARPRWGASGAKSDPGDSYKLADYLRTDGHRLRRLVPVDSGLRELQALVRLRDDHVRARTAAGNQLGALLEQHWPGPRNLFCSLVSDIALNFLTDYPTPQAAARLGEARMAAFCKRHAYRGGKPASALLARLRSAPVAPVSLPTPVLTALITAQVQLLRSLQATITQLETTIKKCLARHPRAVLLARLPGVGTINLAQLLAEVGPILDRVESAEQAAAESTAQKPIQRTHPLPDPRRHPRPAELLDRHLPHLPPPPAQNSHHQPKPKNQSNLTESY